VSTIHASRGEIFAADGSLLAANAYADTLYMDTEKVQDITKVAATVGPVNGMTSSEVIDLFNEEMEDETQIVVLGTYLDGELTDEQKQALLAVPGLGIDDSLYTPIRDYPMGEYTAHMIGYTGFYTGEDIPEGYTDADRAGLTGLEASYESTLRGTDGRIVYIEDKWGKNVRTLYLEPSEEGQDLRLTIQPKLQKIAYDSLSEFLDIEAEETGVAIVLDASTGYVEAMASYPSYDNNLFTFGISQQMWEYYQAPESKEPLFNRATQGLYPPGSVIKPFTASVALDERAITVDTVFTGTIIKNKWLPDEEGWVWDPITRVGNSGTPLKLENALVHSDNIFFAYSALQLDEDDFIGYLSEIGFEESVPFDLAVKSANLVSTELYRRRIAEMGYGQGELLVTPIQMASMYTAFANGSGDMLQPRLVEQTCQTDGLDYNVTQTFEPTVWKKDAVSGSSLNVLLPMLEEVVKSGTGYLAKINGVEIAGKTGTAEIGEDKSREISWFAGYWTQGYYPRLVIVMVDTPAEEGAVKFDIAKELLNP
jgi:penicillin-binding protein